MPSWWRAISICVIGFAINQLGDCSLAEDAVQEASLKAYRNLARLNQPAAFSSWLATIVRNECMNIIRKQSKGNVSLDALIDSGHEPVAPQEEPEFDRELVKALQKVIGRLPEKYREVIELRYTEGASCISIASLLQLNESAVISRLFRARKKILKMLKQEGAV